MLERISGKNEFNTKPGAEGLTIGEALFPVPFKSYLEFNPPAHGTWNIVHTGMLVPEAHIIYVCAAGCLRGVVLTAAEMGTSERFSNISVREHDILGDSMERLIIEGVSDVINRLERRPPAIMIYTSCVHNFMGTDLKYIYKTLRERFPDIDFTDGYMTPIMKKTMPPDVRTWVSVYSLLHGSPPQVPGNVPGRSLEADGSRHKPDASCLDRKSVNIIGCDLPLHDSCELIELAREAGIMLREVTKCKTYGEFQEMASSYMNICIQPVGLRAMAEQEVRLGQSGVYLPLTYDYDVIRGQLRALTRELGISEKDWTKAVDACEKAAALAAEAVGDREISIDVSATPRPLGLAKYLTEHGMKVGSLFLDAFNKEEEDEYSWLCENAPEIMIYPVVDPVMRTFKRGTGALGGAGAGEFAGATGGSGAGVVAIGQKAAYFNGTPYFVNIVEGGALYGYDGIACLMDMIAKAAAVEKDTKDIIPRKAIGCMSVI